MTSTMDATCGSDPYSVFVLALELALVHLAMAYGGTKAEEKQSTPSFY